LDQTILEFTVGNDHVLDERLAPYDVAASQAHVRMLAKCGHLSTSDAEATCQALEALGKSHDEGAWHVSLEEEDIHTALENRLGDLGKRIHLGRSRNDQVLAALRLYMKDAIARIGEQVESLAEALDILAADQGSLPIPGYTHMQRAMPSSVGLWAEGFAAELRSHTLWAAMDLADRNPLGSAAGYGTPGLELDRAQTTQELGFSETQEPVTAPQLSRGKAEAALAFALTLILQDIGRLATDLCLFASQEFAFVRLPDEMTTGSSIMPQKRNPDVFELVRGHSAQAPARLLAILAVTAKMPSGYHRDLQLIKAPLFDLIDTAEAVLEVMTHAIPGLTFDPAKTQAAMSPDLFAAQRAYELVQSQGIPFREAYQKVASELADRSAASHG
jgi:argininosuccinate lyase